MRVSYQLTPSDVAEASWKHRISGGSSRQKITLWASSLFTSGVMLLGVVILVWSPRGRDDGLRAFLIGGIWLLLLWLLPVWTSKRTFEKEKRLQREIVAEISEDGVMIQTSDSRADLKWSAFVKRLESKNLFILYQTAVLMNLFPKRAFAPGDLERFRDLLSRNLPSK